MDTVVGKQMSAAEQAAPQLPAPEDRLTLFVSAIAGHQIMPVAGDDLYTDGRCVFVNPETSSIDGLAVQASLLAIGAFDGHSVARLATRPKLRRRYLLLESRRAVEELAHVLPPRTVRRVLAAYDGPAPSNSQESLELATGGRGIPDAPDWMGLIRPGKLLLANPSTRGRPPSAADKAGMTPEVDIPEADDETEESKFLKLLQAPGGARNPLTQYLQKLLGVGRSAGSSAGGGDEMPVAGHRSVKGRSLFGEIVDAAAMPDDLFFDLAPKGHLYAEWDCHRKRYRPDWCTVTEYDPRVDESERFSAPINLQLRRELARIGMTPERHRRQADGESIDVDAIVERRVDRRAGFDSGDDRIYESQLRTAHDLGVLILLDATGSTGESEEGRRIFDEQRTVLASLTAEFDSLGVRVAAFAFQSWGRQNVQFLRIKGYDDRYSSAVEHRLGTLSPGGFTRLGAAIRHGAAMARSKSGAATDLLVVIGDGLPYDDGYENRYAQEDCRRALTEAVEMGVACTCLSVRSATDATTLNRVWGSVPYEALDDPADLTRKVTSLFRRSLKGAAASRRRIDG